jgi:hypothetical protein
MVQTSQYEAHHATSNYVAKLRSEAACINDLSQLRHISSFTT